MQQRCSCFFLNNRLALFLVFFVFAATSLYATEPVAGAPLLVEGLGKGTVALDGQWQFRVGDDSAWSSPTLDDRDWERLRVDRPWGDQGHYGYAGFAWYRRHIDFDHNPLPQTEVALYIPHVRCAYELYWNGQLIGGFGSVPAKPFFRFAIPQTFGLGRPRQGVLAIRVWTAPLDSSSSGNDRGMTATPLVGTPEAMVEIESANRQTQAKRSLVGFVQMLLLAEVVLIGFVAWVRNRDQKLLFWMIMFLGSSILTLLTTPLDILWLYRIQTIVLWPVHSIEDISLWYLLLYLLDLDRQPSLWRWAKILAVVSLVAATLDNLLFTLAWSNAHVKAFQVLDVVFTAAFSVVQLFPFLIIGYGFKRKLDPPRWFVAVAALAVEMYDVVQHTALQGWRFTHWTLGTIMDGPLFSLGGVPFTPQAILSTLLVPAIAYAVYLEEREHQIALQQEYKNAQELQRVLIPQSLPSLEGYAVTSAYQPAQQVGGDFFQLIKQEGRQEGESALLILGDVSGKGLTAAMTVSLIVGALRTLAEATDDPAEILAGLNRRLHGRLKNGFATCLVLRFDSEGSCVLANAGHLAPFLNQDEMSLPGALPLGLDLNATYDRTAFRLAVGGRLTFYTDGLLEARNVAGEVFSFDRLRALMATEPDATQAAEAAVAFGQDDDITVLTLTRLAIGVKPTTSLLAPGTLPATA
jgi:Stage II sporulation protein E (SpoIIE)